MISIDPTNGLDFAALEIRILRSGANQPVIVDDIQPRSFRMPVYENPDTLRMYARLRKEEKLSPSEAVKTIELLTGDKPNKANEYSFNPKEPKAELPFYHHRKRF